MKIIFRMEQSFQKITVFYSFFVHLQQRFFEIWFLSQRRVCPEVFSRNNDFVVCFISLSFSNHNRKAIRKLFCTLKDIDGYTLASMKRTKCAFVFSNLGVVSAARMLNKIIRYWILKIVPVLSLCHDIPEENCWMICR